MTGMHSSIRPAGRGAWLLLLLLVVGAWLAHLLPAPFHEDEATYAAWALHIERGDPLLWATPVDKPPLTLYPIALSLALFGRHEWAVRLPTLVWTGLALASLWRLAERRGQPGWLAVGLALLSPLLWAQVTSAFTDPAMVALVLLAAVRAATHPRQAGLAFGLALLAKPTGILLLPLVLGEIGSWRLKIKDRRPASSGGRASEQHGLTTENRGGDGERQIENFLLALAAPLLLAWAWDASRDATSWWVLGANAYGTLGHPAARVGAWLRVAWQSFGWMALAGGLFWVEGERQKETANEKCQASIVKRQLSTLQPSTRASISNLQSLISNLLLFAWVPLHLLLGFQPWERYLLPMVPLAALAAARPTLAAGKIFSVRAGALALLLVVAAVPGLVERYDLEPHDGGWQGIDQLGAAVEALPRDAVVAYRALGRPLAWYAADARATLVWAGAEWEALPTLRAQHPTVPFFLVVRATEPLPPGPWELRTQSGDFWLLQ